MMTSSDILYSVITGLTTGIIAWRILMFLEKPRIRGFSTAWLIIASPIGWLVGVWLGYFLAQWYPFFGQFGKFVAIGFTNAAIDFGVLNLFIAYTHHARGFRFTLYKGASFIIATIHSYVWNKYWAFQSHSVTSGVEVANFLIVTLAALFVNVTAASIVVNLIPRQFGMSEKAWATFGAIIGSATALVLSFVGFRIIVFK